MSQLGDQIGISGNAFDRGIPPMTLTWIGPSTTSRSATIFNRLAKGYTQDASPVHDSEGNWLRDVHKNDRVEISIEAKFIGAKQSDARAISADPPIKGQTVTLSGATDSTLNSANWIVSEKPDVSHTPEGEAILSISIHGYLINGSIATISNIGSGRIGIAAGPSLIYDEASQNTRTGSDFEQVFRGTLAEARDARGEALGQGASAVSIRPTGDGEYEMRAQFPFDEDGVEAVPVPSIHELEVDVAQSPWTTNLKLLSLLTPKEVMQIRKIIEDYQAGKYDTTESGHTAEDDAAEEASLINAEFGAEVFFLVAGFGADSFIQYSSVYRRTLTAATPDQVRASRVGEGEIWTTAELVAYENLNNSFFALNNSSQWHKSRAQVIAVANQKTQVVYTYTELYKAAWLLYDAYGDAELARF